MVAVPPDAEAGRAAPGAFLTGPVVEEPAVGDKVATARPVLRGGHEEPVGPARVPGPA